MTILILKPIDKRQNWRYKSMSFHILVIVVMILSLRSVAVPIAIGSTINPIATIFHRPTKFYGLKFQRMEIFFHFHLYFTFIRLASQSKFEQMVFFPYKMLLDVCICVHGPGYLFYVKRILTHMNWLIVISGCVYVCCLSLANKTFTVLICLKVDAKWRCL